MPICASSISAGKIKSYAAPPYRVEKVGRIWLILDSNGVNVWGDEKGCIGFVTEAEANLILQIHEEN